MIEKLRENEIFVFGSNLAGRHDKGAAKTALEKFGAIYGRGQGFQGNSYAIPTKNKDMQVLSLEDIQEYVNYFLNDVAHNRDKLFLVTKIGCGLAGYKVEDIAPLFKKAINIKNIVLPKEFYDYFEKTNKYYTPSIEEFHVGFEYERFDNSCHKKWYTYIVEKGDILDYSSKLDAIRVKYLDQEDIESLGFKQENKNEFTTNLNGDGYRIHYTDKIIISYGTYYDSDNLFIGYIKNKSEFKKLLKQLNIL